MTKAQLARLAYVLDFARPALATVCEQILIEADDATGERQLPDDNRIEAIKRYVHTGALDTKSK